MMRGRSTLGAHTGAAGEGVDLALDGEQGIDALDRLGGDRRLAEPRQVKDLRRACAQQAASTIGPPLPIRSFSARVPVPAPAAPT